MKITTVLTQIGLTAAIIISNLTETMAANEQNQLKFDLAFNKVEKQGSTINETKTDSYLMVMQQQVEKRL
jgi:hypothetical protein